MEPLFQRALTCAAFCACVSAGGKSLSDERKIPVTPPSAEQGFLWKSVSNRQKAGGMTFHFMCDGGGLSRVVLKAEGLPDFIKGVAAVLRTEVANAPPAGRGYKKFIYVGEFSKEEKALVISERETRRFIRELSLLRRQISENRKTEETEYQKKINYCESLSNPRRQKCYQSSSGYQPVPPLMLLTVSVEKEGKPKDFFALFDPKLLKNRNIPCFPSL